MAAAVSLLQEQLQESPKPARELEGFAQEAGVSLRTLRRAKSSLGVTSRREGKDRHAPWVWSLPAESPTEAQGSQESSFSDRLTALEDLVDRCAEAHNQLTGVHNRLVSRLDQKGLL